MIQGILPTPDMARIQVCVYVVRLVVSLFETWDTGHACIAPNTPLCHPLPSFHFL